MSTTDPSITPETARHALWHFGRPGGHQPGSFTQRIMEAASAADPAHQARLALGFPGEVAAVRLGQNERDGIQRLLQIAEGTVIRCTCGDTDGPFKQTAAGWLCEKCATDGVR